MAQRIAAERENLKTLRQLSDEARLHMRSCKARSGAAVVPGGATAGWCGAMGGAMGGEDVVGGPGWRSMMVKDVYG